jgi:CheY-like chemotaxis protein
MRRRGRLLLIEDSGPFGQSLRNEFAERGYEVHLVASGEEAMGLIPRMGRVDAVVMDLGLPDYRPNDLYRALCDVLKRDIVIMMSGTETLIENCREWIAGSRCGFVRKGTADFANRVEEQVVKCTMPYPVRESLVPRYTFLLTIIAILIALVLFSHEPFIRFFCSMSATVLGAETAFYILSTANRRS